MSRHVDYEEGYQPGDVVVGHTSLWRRGDFDWTIEKLLPKRRENTYAIQGLWEFAMDKRPTVVAYNDAVGIKGNFLRYSSNGVEVVG